MCAIFRYRFELSILSLANVQQCQIGKKISLFKFLIFY